VADAFCQDECLWVKHIGGHDVRVVLLSLDPGSRIWLSFDGVAVQFERMKDGADGRSTRGFRPVGDTAHLWRAMYEPGKAAYIEEVEIIERPADKGAVGGGFYQRNDNPSPLEGEGGARARQRVGG
jgi:hypothetical protein